jgi:hypothetical protein
VTIVEKVTAWVSGTCIVLAPLSVGLADQLRMAAEAPSSAGIIDTEYGVQSVLTNLSAISDNQGLFVAAASLAYVGALLAIPALLAIWRLSISASPRWAWTGAVMAALGVTGQVVHVAMYHAMALVASQQEDREGAAQLIVNAETTPFVLAIFTPFFLALLSPVPQAIGLRRARVLPLWACLSVVVGTVFFLFVGSTTWSSAIWTLLLVTGFAPAAAATLRTNRQSASPPDNHTQTSTLAPSSNR